MDEQEETYENEILQAPPRGDVDAVSEYIMATGSMKGGLTNNRKPEKRKNRAR